MIGPTGVGKTEIARRLAALVGAPFVKVEATKYTEVGYVGRDVESMVRDLVDASIRTVTDERREEVRELAARTRSNASSTAPSRNAAALGARARKSVCCGARIDLRQRLSRHSTRSPARRPRLGRRAARARSNARRDRARLLRRAVDRDRGRRDAELADRRDRRQRGPGRRPRRDARRNSARNAARKSALRSPRLYASSSKKRPPS